MWYHYYTLVNLALMAVAAGVYQNTFIYTFLWHNCLAILTSYHAALFIPGALSQFLQVHNQGYAQWTVNNLLGHCAPIAYLYANFPVFCNVGYYESVMCSMASALFHLAWAWIVHGGLSLNKAYICLTMYHWRMLWGIAIATHLVSGVVLPFLLY